MAKVRREIGRVVARAIPTQTLGVYVQGRVYVCPQRIHQMMRTSRKLASLPDLLEIVAIHELMHAVQDAQLSRVDSEHLAQEMAAFALRGSGKTKLLDQMRTLAKSQPPEYAVP